MNDVQPDCILDFDGVEKVYDNGFRALSAVDLTVKNDEIVCLVGPSGCGKTTMLKMAAGLTEPSAGTLRRSTKEISYVFQDPTLLAWRSVRSNVELVARLRGVPRAERRARAEHTLDLVGLSGFADDLPRRLSGGMKMRVSLARAITVNPRLMLMDEPFAALDEFTRANMGEQLLALWREQRFACMFITHSIAEAVELGHRIVVMGSHPGRIKECIDSPAPPTADPRQPRDAKALRATVDHIAASLAKEEQHV